MIDWSKPVRCLVNYDEVRGLATYEEVRVLAVDGFGTCPSHPVIVVRKDGTLDRLTRDGRPSNSYASLYENCPPPKAVGEFTITMRRRASDGAVKVVSGAISSTPVWEVIARKTITITEGEGL